VDLYEISVAKVAQVGQWRRVAHLLYLIKLIAGLDQSAHTLTAKRQCSRKIY
jgi:hypothetical protein